MVQYHLPREPFAAPRQLGLAQLLDQIRHNGGFPVVLLNGDDSLFGVASSGDIASYLARHPGQSLEVITAEAVANQSPLVGHVSDSLETIEGYLTPQRIRCLPVLDTSRRVVRVVSRQEPFLQIGRFRIGPQSPPLLLAEIGVNHNGNSDEALWLVRQAAAAGCHAVKFQHRGHDLYNRDDINSFDLGTQYIIAEIERTRLPISILADCCCLARDLGMEAVVTPFDETALQELMASEAKPAALKIASCDLTNHPLIRACAAIDLPLVLSTGMSYERDIQATSQLLRTLMVEHAFLHCNSTYPAPPHDINLAYLPRLRDITRTIVGYSSHDGDPVIPTGAVAHGARIVEFHITRSHDAQGTDHRASIEVEALPAFVRACALIHEATGQAMPRTPSQGELANRQSLGKSYALRHDRPVGHRLQRDDLILVSPGSGYGIDDLEGLVGRSLVRPVTARRLLRPADLDGSSSGVLQFLAPAVAGLQELGYIPGIPVRYHDATEMQQAFALPMLEFHMSDRDLHLDPGTFLPEPLHDVDLIVHAVEQYEDGFILDLASADPLILQRSFNEVQRLCEHISRLRSFFRPTEQVPVVLNLGGFTTDGFLAEDEYRHTLDRAARSLEQLADRHRDVSLLPQTMPPFPWHQGGRSFHNLLTSRERVQDFLLATNTDLCFDVSHTALSCAHFGEQLIDHVATMAGRIAHVHLSDAQGTNAEGLEVGEGSIDFRRLHQAMQVPGQHLFMIPEIWQGHLQGGEKFARSLIRYHERLL
jgi:sialic acid synthase SpsE/sugar phosphate isomerase/epimerase